MGAMTYSGPKSEASGFACQEMAIEASGFTVGRIEVSGLGFRVKIWRIQSRPLECEISKPPRRFV